jgi:outer membrane immunogenic protein
MAFFLRLSRQMTIRFFGLSAILFFIGDVTLHGGTEVDASKDKPISVVPTAGFDWSGFYAGGNVGAHWASYDFSRSTEVLPEILVNQTIFPKTAVGIPELGTDTEGNVLGGGQVGYNWQLDRFVFGLEADGEAAPLESQVHFNSTVAVRNATGEIRLAREARTDWLVSTRARAGYAVCPALLLYVTGGPALADIRAFRNDLFSATENTGSSVRLRKRHGADNQTDVGWTIGCGAEYGLNETYSFGLEYRHTEIDSDTLAFKTNGLVISRGGSVDLSDDQILVKVNVHLMHLLGWH